MTGKMWVSFGVVCLNLLADTEALVVMFFLGHPVMAVVWFFACLMQLIFIYRMLVRPSYRLEMS